jgi:hypothetical protein
MSMNVKVWLGAVLAVLAVDIAMLVGRDEQHAADRSASPRVERSSAQPAASNAHTAATARAVAPTPHGPPPALVPGAPSGGQTAPQQMVAEIRHECFLAEHRDEAWAPVVEVRMRAFFARHPYGNTFQIASIECRATLCEIHASTDKPVELADPQGSISPAAWQSVIGSAHQDATLAAEFDDDGLLPAARFGERAEYTAVLVRRSGTFTREARCAGDGEVELRARALVQVTDGYGSAARTGLPTLNDDIIGSAFKLAAYFEAEDRDERWATAMEALIGDTLAAFPSTHSWRGTSIECRTTLCRIRASTTPDGADEVREIIARILRESSGFGLTRLANGMSKDPDDPTRVVHIVTLSRAR